MDSKEKSLAQNTKLMLREGVVKLDWFFVNLWGSGLGGDLLFTVLLAFLGFLTVDSPQEQVEF